MSDQPDNTQVDPIHELAVGLAPVFTQVVDAHGELGHMIGEAVLDAQESREVVEAHVDGLLEHHVQAHDDGPTTIDAGDYHVSPAEHDLPTET